MNWSWPKLWVGETGGWWRVLITLAFSALGVVLGLLLYTQASLSGIKEALKNEPAHVHEIATLIATLLITGLGLIGCLLGVRFVHHKPIARVFTDGRTFETRLALQSAAVWAVLWLGFTLPLPGAWAGLIQRTSEIPLAWWPIIFVLAVAAMTAGRVTEEVLFRGYLLTRVAAWVKRPWLAVGIVAVGFCLVHQGNPAARVAITLFGIVWGAACVRAGTLAPMIGAHVLHDTFNILLQPRNQLNEANASTSWLEVGLIAPALAIWLGWLFWATRERQSTNRSSTLQVQATVPRRIET